VNLHAPIRQGGHTVPNRAARSAITAAAPASLKRCPGGVHRRDIGRAHLQCPRVLQIAQHTLAGDAEAAFSSATARSTCTRARSSSPMPHVVAAGTVPASPAGLTGPASSRPPAT
jgi:hypothetical protein